MNNRELRQISINEPGEYEFSLTEQDQVFPNLYALTIITPVNLRAICDCNEFQELVWGNQRTTLLTTPGQVINCIVTNSTTIPLKDNIYFVPGNTYTLEAPRELIENIHKIEYYYSIIREILGRNTLFLLNREKYNYSINNIVSIKEPNDLKNYIVELMRNKHINEDIVYYFINENLTIWYLRKMVKK